MLRRLTAFAFPLLALLVACAPASPSATTGGTAPAPEQRAEQQIFNIAVSRFSEDLSPRAFSSNPWMFSAIYDSVTVFGSNWEVRPAVATAWDLSADGLTWTFTIRPDVRFSNGDPVTAQDVAFSFNLILQNRSWPAAGVLSTATEARVVDANRVAVSTRILDMSLPSGAPLVYVIQQRYWESVGGLEGFVRRPMGSGPYEIVEQRPGMVHFRKRNTPHAFRNPQNSELIFREVLENSQAIAGLRTGDVDLIMLRTFAAEQAQTIQRIDGATLVPFMNSNASMRMPQGVAEARNTPLTDKRVRQAINYAVNRQAIAQNIMGGFATPVGQNGIPGGFYWDPSLEAWPYDPARARQLLAEAGYPNGFRLTGGLDFTPSASSPDIPLAIQSDLRAVGILIEVVPVELATFQDKIFGRNNAVKGDIIFSGAGDRNGWFSGIRGTVGCGRPAGAPAIAVNYCNPEWDRTFDAALSERDPARRTQLYRQAARIEREDVWTLYTHNSMIFHAYGPKVRGFQHDVQNNVDFDRLYRIR